MLLAIPARFSGIGIDARVHVWQPNIHAKPLSSIKFQLFCCNFKGFFRSLQKKKRRPIQIQVRNEAGRPKEQHFSAVRPSTGFRAQR
jgi:hypothetical protein